MNIVFVILIIIAMKGVEIHITFPSALTNSYYEIYLMQNCSMLALRDVTSSFPVYWLGVMLLTVVLAVLMHKGNRTNHLFSLKGAYIAWTSMSWYSCI